MSLSLFDLTGKRALITGSSQGIGLALAQGLAAAGAAIVLNGSDQGKLDEAAHLLRREGAEVAVLMGVIDFLLGQRLDDGGFNCDASRSERRLSSVHTTTSVIDGFAEYLRRGYVYRADEVHLAVTDAAEALLARHLYQRRGDGEPIRTEFTRLHHPARWHFDVLRGLEVLRLAGVDWEPRMVAAMDVVARRRRQDGRWAGSSQYPGQTWVSYPGAGEPNRWVTLRALRVVRWAGAAVRSAGPPAG